MVFRSPAIARCFSHFRLKTENVCANGRRCKRYWSKRLADKTGNKLTKFVEQEAENIFGSSWEIEGNERGVKNNTAAFVTQNNSRKNGTVKSSAEQTAQTADVSSAKTDPNIRRRTAVRELDPILTFPLLEATPNPTELVPRFSAETEVPILNSEEVAMLDKKSAMPSVSLVLEKSRPPEEQAMLDRWKAKMISELGEEGFAQWQKETFARGHNLHACIQKQLETGDGADVLDNANAAYWHSIKDVFPDFSQVCHTEQYVRHPHLKYHGYFDCVANFRDKQCLVEWKTSKRQKATLASTFDYPLQVAAYMGAVNFDQRYDLTVDGGLIVVAYENGSPADVHRLTREQSLHYWGLWLHRLYTYWRLTLSESQERQRAADSVS